jgi:hypothetical protein
MEKNQLYAVGESNSYIGFFAPASAQNMPEKTPARYCYLVFYGLPAGDFLARRNSPHSVTDHYYRTARFGGGSSAPAARARRLPALRDCIRPSIGARPTSLEAAVSDGITPAPCLFCAGLEQKKAKTLNSPMLDADSQNGPAPNRDAGPNGGRVKQTGRTETWGLQQDDEAAVHFGVLT